MKGQQKLIAEEQSLPYLSEGLLSRQPKASQSLNTHSNAVNLTGVQFWELPWDFSMLFRYALDKNPSFLSTNFV